MRHCLASIFSVLLSISLASIALAESSSTALVIPTAAAYVPPARMAGNIDSWIALAIVVTSVITAWAINYSAPKVRVFGTLLAALGCFTVAAWFLIYVVNTGFLENPKPNQTPLDSAKPALLWIQAMIALAAGLFLIFVAARQRNSQEALILTSANEPHRYGRVSRLLHWTTAGLFLILIPMGIFTSIIPEQTQYRNAYYVVHKTLGVTALLLLVIRLVWNRISQRPALDSTLTSRERQLARFAHFTLYMMMLALPVTGFMMTSLHGYPTYFFAWELAPLWPQSDAYILWGAMHKYLLPYLLYIVLGAHILGALKHHFIEKKPSAFKRMGG
ncbi:MAG: cytochrome b [Porticoccaceae bacterium]